MYKNILIVIALASAYGVPYSNLVATDEVALIRGGHRLEEVHPQRAADLRENQEHREAELIEGERETYPEAVEPIVPIVPIEPERKVVE